MLNKTKIAVLVSGGGTNLQALINAQAGGIIKSGEIVLVVSNVPGAYALERARMADIDAVTLSRKALGGQAKFEEALQSELLSHGVELIVLAGFLSILSADFTSKWPDRIINIHPALIPSFCGKGFYGLHVHEAALAYGVKVTGATVHFVNEVPDGGKIIAQKPVYVRDGDTPETLQRRVMEEAEWVLLPEATEKISREILIKKERAKHMLDIGTLLRENTYPGRGIILGRSKDGKKAVVAYFIMGRSVNSRNRVFEATEDGIRTRAFDESKMEDPSLIIYHPVRVFEGSTIVTNGDQTDTIRDSMRAGHCYRHALHTRTFEPDGPNWTPRISGVVTPDGKYSLSILKSMDGDPECCCRYFFEYDNPIPGCGHFIHTYKRDGDPIPSFEGEPERIAIEADTPKEFAALLWDSLNADNKVSLYVSYIDIASGKADSVIINKNK